MWAATASSTGHEGGSRAPNRVTDGVGAGADAASGGGCRGGERHRPGLTRLRGAGGRRSGSRPRESRARRGMLQVLVAAPAVQLTDVVHVCDRKSVQIQRIGLGLRVGTWVVVMVFLPK